MKREYILISLFFLIAAIFFYLFYRIVIPFFAPICWAAVFAIICYPLNHKLQTKIKSKRITSAIMCLLILLLIIGPMAYLFTALVNEAAGAVSTVNTMYKSGELDKILSFDLPWIDTMKEKLAPYYDISEINLDKLIKTALDNVSGVIFAQTSWIIANGTRAIFYFFLMIFTMYYFFKDGEELIHKLKRLMPLPSDQVNKAFHYLGEVTQATMYGGIVVALIQGLLGGILFALVGIPSAVFWGAIMAFLAFIPLVGAFIVYVPAGIVLILGGSFIKGIIVILVGSLVISQSENVIRPMLISGRTAIHPLLLFFSIMGGIYLFGLLGIVLGPLIAAIFLSFLNIFEMKLHPEDETPSID